MYEVEAKGRLLIDGSEAIRRLSAEGFQFGAPNSQVDLIFAAHRAHVIQPRDRRSVARVRLDAHGGATLNVKTYTQQPLTRIEHETVIQNAEEGVAILRALGLHEIVRVAKIRRQATNAAVTACIDAVEGLGDFIEFELLLESEPTETSQRELYQLMDRLLPNSVVHTSLTYDQLILAAEPDSQPTVSSVLAASTPFSTVNFGDFSVHVTNSDEGRGQDVILVKGDVVGQQSILCRITSRCMMSTAFDADDCDCAQQIELALHQIHILGRGVIIYLDQEGRGHGLVRKVEAMSLKRRGFDTFSAFEEMGLTPDVTDYSRVPEMLSSIGVASIILMSNNPAKAAALADVGVAIDDIIPCAPSDVPTGALRHLEAKRLRGHTLDPIGDADAVGH